MLFPHPSCSARSFSFELLYSTSSVKSMLICLILALFLYIITSIPPLSDSSTPDVSLKPRVSEASELQAQQHNGAPYLPLSRTPFPAVTVDQSITTYSGMTECRGAEMQTVVTISEVQSLVKFIFTSHRKPNNSSLRYISQPSGLLRLLCHVTAILVP